MEIAIRKFLGFYTSNRRETQSPHFCNKNKIFVSSWGPINLKFGSSLILIEVKKHTKKVFERCNIMKNRITITTKTLDTEDLESQIRSLGSY